MDILFKVWLNTIKWIFILCLPFLVISPLVLTVIDKVHPSSIVKTQINKHYPNETTISIGISSSESRDGDQYISDKQRSYLLPKRAELITVHQTKANEAETISLTSSKAGFWIFLIVYALIIFLTIKFSIPKILRR